MKAWVLQGIDQLELNTAAKPEPKSTEVLLKVQAAGICGSDIPRIYKTGAHVHPLIPGHEFAGQVVALGEEVSDRWLNKRVGVFPLIPCKKCMPCKKGQYEMCRNYSYLGSRRDGGFAEYVAVPEENLIELPEHVSFEEAAMMEPMAVAVHAMRRIMPEVQDSVVVCGLGTIGMLLVMFLIDAGINHILVIGNKQSQKQAVLDLGLEEACYCDSRTQDVNTWVMEHTKGNGADVILECVGKNETVEQSLNLAAPAGRICLVGNPYSDMNLHKDAYWKILRNQLIVTGTWNSTFNHQSSDDWHYVLDRLEQKKVQPSKLITHRYPMEEMEQGFHIMRDKSEDYIKIMMNLED